jgi:hypothetical protein
MGSASGAGQNSDQAPIRQTVMRLQEAWNRHDMKAFANLFAEDADFVNVAGAWWKGRAEIEEASCLACDHISRQHAFRRRSGRTISHARHCDRARFNCARCAENDRRHCGVTAASASNAGAAKTERRVDDRRRSQHRFPAANAAGHGQYHGAIEVTSQ